MKGAFSIYLNGFAFKSNTNGKKKLLMLKWHALNDTKRKKKIFLSFQNKFIIRGGGINIINTAYTFIYLGKQN